MAWRNGMALGGVAWLMTKMAAQTNSSPPRMRRVNERREIMDVGMKRKKKKKKINENEKWRLANGLCG